ncbi:MAG: AAA family ATPase [Gordonia paraffinivorans]
MGWADELGHRPRRIAVAGVAGSGKTTACRRIAPVIGTGHIEIDGLFHGPNWTPRPAFVDDVRSLVAQDSWVVEWQYASVRDLIADRCDVLLWLDFPFWRVTFPRVVRRTIRRRVRREVLWNGNVEQGLSRIAVDSTHIVRWAIGTRNAYREMVPDAARRHPGATVVRIRTPTELDGWIDGVLTIAQAD